VRVWFAGSMVYRKDQAAAGRVCPALATYTSLVDTGRSSRIRGIMRIHKGTLLGTFEEPTCELIYTCYWQRNRRWR
jgi:hypothetical protein